MEGSSASGHNHRERKSEKIRSDLGPHGSKRGPRPAPHDDRHREGSSLLISRVFLFLF